MTETATAGERHAQPAEPDISPVPDVSGHFVVGAVGVAEEGGACEAPGVAYGGRFAPEALVPALDDDGVDEASNGVEGDEQGFGEGRRRTRRGGRRRTR